MNPKATLHTLLLAVGSSLFAVSAANAQTWNGSVDDSWDNDSNWSVAPVNGNSLTFSGTANQTNTNDAGITSVNIFTLENAGWNIGLGGSAFTITTLNANGSSNLTGTVRFNFGDRVITLNGSNTTLDLAGTIELARSSNQTLTVNGAGNTLEVDNLQMSVDNVNRNRTIAGTADIMVNGGIIRFGTGTDNLTKTNTGIMTVKGTSTYTGSTTVNAGTFDLGGSGTGGSLASTALTLGRAVFNYTRTGTNTQTFTTTNINGESAINVAAGNTLDLGTLTKGSVRSTVTFSGTGTIKGDIANDANGIIGGWATIGGDWAVSNGAGNAITAYGAGSYDTTSVLGDAPGSYAGKMISVNNNQTLSGVITPSTLNFRTAAAHTLTLATGDNDVDGIRVTGDVGNNASVITGGTLRAGTASGALNIIQNNTANTLTINSDIANNTSNSSFVKSGDGTLIMVGSISSTGGVTIQGGTLQLGDGGSNGGLSNQTVVNNGHLIINRDTNTNYVNSPFTGTGSVTLITGNREFTLASGNTYSGGFTQNGGNISGLVNGTYNGFGTGTVTVNSVGNNGWRISGTGSNVILNNEMAWNSADMKLYTQSSGVDATATWNGNVTLGADVNVTQTGNQASQISHVFNGNIGQTGGTRSLTFSGGDGTSRSPVFTLNGTNTYTGNTTTTNVLSTLVIGGSGSLNSGNYAGNISAAGDFKYSSSANQTLSGSVTAVNLSKDTADSTLNLSNATGNTITGVTTVSAGTLFVNNTSGSGTGTGTVSVGAGGTLGGSGIIAGDTTIAGVHSPGNSPGILTHEGNLTYEAGASVLWELATNSVGTRGTHFDGIDVGGDLSFTADTSINLSFNFSGSAVDWTNAFWQNSYLGTNGWLIYDVAGATANFSNLTLNTDNWIDSESQAFNDNLAGSFSLFQSGTDIYLNYDAIPEPSAVLFGVLGAFGLLVRRRR